MTKVTPYRRPKLWPAKAPKQKAFEPKENQPGAEISWAEYGRGTSTEKTGEVWATGYLPASSWVLDGDTFRLIRGGREAASITREAQRATIARVDSFIRSGCRVQLIEQPENRTSTHYRVFREAGRTDWHVPDCQCEARATAAKISEPVVRTAVVDLLLGRRDGPYAASAGTMAGRLASCITNPGRAAKAAA